MHIFNMLLIAVQSFKMNAWKPWEELITQSYYLLLKPNLKIVWVQNAVILSRTIFLPAKSHMRILNMLVRSVQSFKMIAWNSCEKLITQTCYPILKPNLKRIGVQNAVILSKMIFLPAKSHMHIFNMFIAPVQSF